ncbi:hypothetical protein F511_19201 [Dorcoceras hygrometricum]|uniref:Uncharacterized protein n=1 Tax=Dorcoceras hygrometricum TaxID=472368 RepID=A0A2Z7AAM0_9LAMI|nr:hypothetical protein F511_19201 [Dorcoceras hygrometricum]
MSDKSYSARELVKEDLLCHFGYGQEDTVEGLEGASRGGILGGRTTPVVKKVKRKAPQSTEKEVKHSKNKRVSTSQAQVTPNIEKRRAPMPPSPSPPVHSQAISRSHPLRRDRGHKRILVDLPPSTFLKTPWWSPRPPGLAGRRNCPVRNMDEVLEHHTELEMQLEELEGIRAQEKRAAEAQKEVLEAQGKKLAAEKAVLAVEKNTVKSKLEALAIEKAAIEVELDETRARAEGEISCLKSEVANVWGLGKEEFLKSSEFDELCAKKSVDYFE